VLNTAQQNEDEKWQRLRPHQGIFYIWKKKKKKRKEVTSNDMTGSFTECGEAYITTPSHTKAMLTKLRTTPQSCVRSALTK